MKIADSRALELVSLKWWDKAFVFELLTIWIDAEDYSLIGITYRGDYEDGAGYFLWLFGSMIHVGYCQGTFEFSVYLGGKMHSIFLPKQAA